MKKLHVIPMLLAAAALAACVTTPADTQIRSAQPAAMSPSALELRQTMRELWADHVVWTRAYIVAAVADDPSAQSALDRLMKNQEDLGNAIAPYYGAAAAAELTRLLKAHISVAGEVVGAAKAQDNLKLTDANRRWHRNAEEIATFLSRANPNWQRADLVNMLNEHLALTTQEATFRLHQKWSDDTAVFDKIFHQAMMMADALSDGVVRQFAARF